MSRQPMRVQLRRTKGWRMPESGVESEARRSVILAEIANLRGKNLACWCPLDQPCHADVLLEIANAPIDAVLRGEG
ncbi:hypothetical protein V473_07255 [Sphingobium cupriresistens LL01]|uniref:DUF4326 domain-containing protein n=2 Tax=Sphingobium cupriresistens TaxID=1132417 RepID=A0A0J7Y3G3_9SPHN|nr:hypothetical protein V473_07255 [Sphingobium cupriresistens LL01]